jgi:hypothetical protein
MAHEGAAAYERLFDLSALLGVGDVVGLGRRLDELDDAARQQFIHGLGARAQAQLYEAAKGARKLRLDSLVPAQLAPLTQVVHEGKNSLPVFSSFAKVMCRAKDDAQVLWGYNRTGPLLSRAVGPGYFVAHEGPGDEVLIDYTRVPPLKPEGWPEILSNKARLSRFVYAGMIDALRAVSEHVSVGRAIRNGKVQDNWFVLCRTEPVR